MKISTILLFILGITLIIGGIIIYSIFISEGTIEKIACYNEFQNKIIGLSCENKTYPYQNLSDFMILIGFLLILFGTFKLIIGDNW